MKKLLLEIQILFVLDQDLRKNEKSIKNDFKRYSQFHLLCWIPTFANILNTHQTKTRVAICRSA